jgi:hypothetical protein
MNIDPTMNLVVFEVKHNNKVERFTAQGATKDANCIKKAWESIRQQQSLQPTHVSQIYSEWQPSDEDKTFLEKTFDKAKVSYSFERPSDGNWEVAFAKVREIIEQSLKKDTPNENRDQFVFFPILRDTDKMADIIVHTKLIPELSLFLAKIGTTQRGTVGIDYVMSKQAKDENVDIPDLWQRAFSNLAKGLQVKAVKSNGHQFFMLTREDGLAAAAIGLPNFFDQATNWIESKQIVVAIPDPNNLIVCAANSPVVAEIQQKTLASEYVGAVALTPCVLLIDNGKISLKTKRG